MRIAFENYTMGPNKLLHSDARYARAGEERR